MAKDFILDDKGGNIIGKKKEPPRRFPCQNEGEVHEVLAAVLDPVSYEVHENVGCRGEVGSSVESAAF